MAEKGTILAGKYELQRRIGAGGMGTVYEALHLHTERRVAVKFLRAELADKTDVRARFLREARAAGRVDHDNVCEVLDSGVDEEGTHYLVMPLLRGRSLKDLLDREGALPLERAVDITAQILGALTVAHERGVIHRDLKPGNIFLTEVAGRADFVKILDFGVTKLDGVEGVEDLSSLTRTGAVLGTPCYMAPEQARGAKDITGQVDLYAVGVILYESLTGRRPVEGETYNEVLWKLWNAPITPPSAYRTELPSALEAVALRALVRSRQKRYGDAATMRAELLAALGGVDLAGLRESTPPRRSSAPSTLTEETSSDEAPDDEPAALVRPISNGDTTLTEERFVAAPRRGLRALVAMVLAGALFGGLAMWLPAYLVGEAPAVELDGAPPASASAAPPAPAAIAAPAALPPGDTVEDAGAARDAEAGALEASPPADAEEAREAEVAAGSATPPGASRPLPASGWRRPPARPSPEAPAQDPRTFGPLNTFGEVP